MDVCLQYWIRWMRAIERKSGGYRKGWLKWWVLGTMLHHKLKEKWLLDCQKKEWVFINTSWIWYILASWKSITLPGPPPAFSFLKHLFGLYRPHLSALPQHKNLLYLTSLSNGILGNQLYSSPMFPQPNLGAKQLASDFILCHASDRSLHFPSL